MILRTRDGGDVEYRSSGFSLTQMVRWGYMGLRNVPGGMAQKTVAGVPALSRAVRIRSEAVATLQLRVWRGERSPLRQRADQTWQSQFFQQERYNDQQTRFEFWETIEESVAWRGNAWAWKVKDPSSGRLLSWYALHPDQVVPAENDQWVVTVADGYVDPVGRGPARYIVGDDVVLHFRGPGDGGKRVAPSPIEVFREAMSAPVSRMRHENRMWQRGTALQQAVQFPPGTTREDANQWRDEFEAKHEGTDGGTTLVVGGGAQVKTIGMTLTDANYVAMAGLTAQDAAYIMGVQAPLLGMQLERREDLQTQTASWLRFGLGPELTRLESALAADSDLFPRVGQSGRIWPAFDTDGFVRGDILTESTILVQEVQAGILLPDEARALEGRDPLPDGAGQIPQITPVGGAPNPSNQPSAVAATLPDPLRDT